MAFFSGCLAFRYRSSFFSLFSFDRRANKWLRQRILPLRSRMLRDRAKPGERSSAGRWEPPPFPSFFLILGSGLGLSVVSPWSGAGASAAAVGVGTVVWLIVVQWVASAFGGYLTGRTRPRGEPSDEVFFRDTANGFLAWALATLLVAALLTSAISAIVGAGAQVVATVVSGAAQGTASGIGQSAADPTAYLVDSLYRPAAAGADPGASPGTAPATAPGTAAPTAAPADSNGPAAAPVGNGPAEASRADAGVGQPAPTGDLRAETGKILVAGMGSDEFPAEDTTYLADQIPPTPALLRTSQSSGSMPSCRRCRRPRPTRRQQRTPPAKLRQSCRSTCSSL